MIAFFTFWLVRFSKRVIILLKYVSRNSRVSSSQGASGIKNMPASFPSGDAYESVMLGKLA
jgi:hypothetical protein